MEVDLRGLRSRLVTRNLELGTIQLITFVVAALMFFKLRQRYLLLFVFAVLGLSISFFPSYAKLGAAWGSSPSRSEIVIDRTAAELETQGKYFYSLAQFEQAVDSWQQAIALYGSEELLNRARVMSNLALAQSQLNHWTEAQENIAASLKLLRSDRSLNQELTPQQRTHALAQVLNNQGILQLNQGEGEQAIATWKAAREKYQQVGDELGVIRASINQASAFKQLGLYRRALKTLSNLESSLVEQPDSQLKVAGLRSYGDILRLVGETKRSQTVLRSSLEIAESLDSDREQIKILLVLGNTYKARYPQQALKLYQQALKVCQQQNSCLQSDLSLQIHLTQLNTLLSTPDWQQSNQLTTKIEAEFAQLPLNRANVDRRLNFAHSLVKLSHRANTKHPNTIKADDSQKIEQFLAETTRQAQKISYIKAQSYSWGLHGQIKEELQDWSTARQYTQQASTLAQSINAPEVIYLWQWQLGRIEQALGERSQAISHYSQGVELLKSLSRDLVAIDPDVQYSFRDSVEPVYRGLVSLLLETSEGDSVSQTNLERGREVIESLQLAELNNFFREACLDAQVVKIDNVDRQAAVIYPIILSDRLEVIVSLPDQPLKHYSTKIKQAELESVINRFRQNIVIRSRRKFYHPARQLYDLVIRPALNDLTKNQIETLVFVPDGAFRNAPLSALYDGKHFLLEDYSIALTPGLQLLNPKPLEQENLRTIAAGLTASVDGFSSLDYVNSELAEIESRVNSRVLVDQEFTGEALKKAIQFSDYPIVHIATHGQFSSSLEDTFILAWDDRININDLDSILQTRKNKQGKAIELLVLSACETAAGDNRAALGLAGMAVRAGAKSTLATLWSVNDRATSKLMSNFYYELSEQHLPKAEAMRQAQLKLLHNPWSKHPFYWASYVMLGNWL